ncbi:hypothetical protein R1sor_019431 [Riccia sorocarpa]|uniref:Uncharacterized protein n=1 Tax=Riccia sorocarpa TaxID=122646 RepID=A0ABD3IE80_9MARC
MRYVSRLLQGEKSEWATMMRSIIHQEMLKRVKGKEYCWWSVEEGLLLLPVIPSPKNSTVRSFVKAWTRFRGHLKLNEKAWSLPGFLTMSQVSILTKRYCRDYSFNEKTLNPLLRTLKYTSLMHLCDSSGQWHNLQRELEVQGVTLTEHQVADVVSNSGSKKETLTRNRCMTARAGNGALKTRSGKGGSGKRALRFRAEEVDAKFRIPGTLLDTIDIAISDSRKGSPLIHILAATLQAIWRDMNAMIGRLLEKSLPPEQSQNDSNFVSRGSPSGDGRVSTSGQLTTTSDATTTNAEANRIEPYPHTRVEDSQAQIDANIVMVETAGPCHLHLRSAGCYGRTTARLYQEARELEELDGRREWTARGLEMNEGSRSSPEVEESLGDG